MKNIKILLLIAALMISVNLSAQQKPFHGAIATKKIYRAVYQLNSGDEKKISSTLKNIKNALEDQRLVGKLNVELVVHGDAVIAFKKNSPYEQQLLALQKQGVLLAQCENTIKERNIKKDELFDFISYVPSAAGELIIRQAQGWSILHP